MRKAILSLSVVALLAAAPVFAWGVDSDNDGIRDRKDDCQATPVGAKVDKKGCPVDSDSDGVPSGIDKCAKTPTGWPVDEWGCPKDSDRDQVVDARDTCAATLSGARVDANGCPSDSDGDAVLDGLDRCQGTVIGHRVDGLGCPIDTDHDGVNDSLDLCADSGPRESVDAGGCRVKAPELFPAGTDTIRVEGVNFEKNQIEAAPDSGPILMNVAASMKDWPDTRVEIAVHTDPKGSASKNKELSQRRAAYLATYLATLGVDPARVAAKGYGESAHMAERTVELRQLQEASAVPEVRKDQ